ncbi:MAG: hypothetical protein CSA21_06380 [Deltaproteobacteria bacterium]|nr:MAG: hypothetical protein CSA21_06380 [Deltaproteobacteria bacterium]
MPQFLRQTPKIRQHWYIRCNFGPDLLAYLYIGYFHIIDTGSKHESIVKQHVFTANFKRPNRLRVIGNIRGNGKTAGAKPLGNTGVKHVAWCHLILNRQAGLISFQSSLAVVPVDFM